MTTAHARRRQFVFPEAGDTITTIAARLWPAEPSAAQRLLSWNLHLALRRNPVGTGTELLGTDIVYVEEPLL